MERPERIAVVYVGLVYALVECVFGLLLVLAAASRGHLPSAWLDVVKAGARNDVGAFPARWLLNTTRGLQRGGKYALGFGLTFEGALKAGLLIGVLRGSRTATAGAALLFGALALGSLIVAGANPPIGAFITASLNVALAVVVVLELRRVVADVGSGRVFRSLEP